MEGPPLTLWLWLAAFTPVALLFVLVASGRVRAQWAAAIVLAVTLGIGTILFRAGMSAGLVALGKGLWLGLWILYVVWPALLLYRIASVAGLQRIGSVFRSILPRRRENLLIVCWVFPAFIQGVAGFGTPIAVAAPLLVAMGWSKTRAVVYPLVGYHWAVTFGSMGSSYYMAALTAQLDGPSSQQFAVLAAALLGLSCLLAPVLVLLLDGGREALREGAPLILIAGAPMALTLVGTAAIVPAVASLAAGTVGLIAVTVRAAVLRRREPRDAVMPASPMPAPGPVPGGSGAHEPPAWQLLAPYGYLLATALPVFLFPPTRAWVQQHAVVALDFPGSVTGWGWEIAPARGYTPIALLAHPGFYIVLAAVLGYLTYRRVGLWQGTSMGAVLRAWMRSLPQASLSILMLAAVAAVLIDAGMVSILARGLTAATGGGYPILAPWVGSIGSFMTGSTTTSNALFAALQRDVSQLLDLPPALLLAAQTAGGNAGNAIAPVVILIGVTAVEAADLLPVVLRRTLPPMALILAVLSVVTFALSLLLG